MLRYVLDWRVGDVDGRFGGVGSIVGDGSNLELLCSFAVLHATVVFEVIKQSNTLFVQCRLH